MVCRKSASWAPPLRRAKSSGVALLRDRLLRQTRAIPGHVLDQMVRHRGAYAGPDTAPRDVAEGKRRAYGSVPRGDPDAGHWRHDSLVSKRYGARCLA